jgi:hypothetical protein
MRVQSAPSGIGFVQITLATVPLIIAGGERVQSGSDAAVA